ncbi:PilZ domain-containing protein [Geodermatophilus sp. SYSU D01176]
MATAVPGVDYPEAREPVDVQAASRGDVLTSFVHEAADGALVLTVPMDRSSRRVRVDLGEYAQLVWKGPEGLRALPVELVEVIPGDEPHWRVKPMGPSTRGQRRNAVRAPMSLPVEVLVGEVQLIGETVDVSEGGVRSLFQPVGGTATKDRAPAPAGGESTAPSDRVELPVGSRHDVALALGSPDEPIRCSAEVVRRHPRTDRRIEVSLRFVDLPERDEDRIRARVFTELRVLRSRGLL